VSAIAPPPVWPADPEHREAIDTLLVMAEAEDRWGECTRAAELLDSVEEIIERLPRAYEQMRSRCRRSAAPGPGAR
jgi:hypothetical protein